jgi:hypothetical protein
MRMFRFRPARAFSILNRVNGSGTLTTDANGDNTGMVMCEGIHEDGGGMLGESRRT